MFAHCETLVPLATLLGLFKPDPADLLLSKSGFQQQHQHEPQQAAMDAAVLPRAAARHLAQVDSLDDLQLVVQR